MTCVVVIGELCLAGRNSSPMARKFALLFAAKNLRLVREIRINLNLEREFRSLLCEVGYVYVLMDTEANGARYLQFDGFF